MSDTVILEIIKTSATLAGLIITGLVSVRLGRLHQQINSRMDLLLEETKKASRAEGKVEGKSEEKAKAQESAPTYSPVQLTGATKLKIVEGEINVKPSEAKKKG